MSNGLAGAAGGGLAGGAGGCDESDAVGGREGGAWWRPVAAGVAELDDTAELDVVAAVLATGVGGRERAGGGGGAAGAALVATEGGVAGGTGGDSAVEGRAAASVPRGCWR
jgi:hypothetical protein